MQAAVDAVLRMHDGSALVDLIRVLCARPNLWTIDTCCQLLPDLHQLLDHQIDAYAMHACDGIKLILRNVAPLVSEMLRAPPSVGVDLQREDRLSRSRYCKAQLDAVKATVMSRLQSSASSRKAPLREDVRQKLNELNALFLLA